MASVATGAFVAINGIDLSLVMKSVKFNATADIHDRTALGNTAARTFQKGWIDRGVSGESFFKSSTVTSENADTLFQTALTSTTADYLMLFGRDGSAVGDPAVMSNLKEAKYDINTIVGDLVMAQFDAKVSATATAGTFQTGVFLFNQSVTVAANGTSYDTTTGGTGYLIQVHVLSTVAAANTADVVIQHSTDNAAWSDLTVNAIFTESTGTQLSSTVTAVSRYVRVAAEANGTSAIVAVGMKIGYTG